MSISRDHLSRGCFTSFYLVAGKIDTGNEDVIETSILTVVPHVFGFQLLPIMVTVLSKKREYIAKHLANSPNHAIRISPRSQLTSSTRTINATRLVAPDPKPTSHKRAWPG